ncbi:MAG: hypothetical protein KF819_08615 [Labilithrix sp.]|nr:hypothetical protein [Labilithrix sp.]
MSSNRRLSARPVAALFTLWIIAASVVSAYLLGPHVLAIPTPGRRDPRLARVASLDPSKEGRWVVAHFVRAGCRCSGRVMDHLVRRGAIGDALEVVVYALDGEPLDEALAARARARGFTFVAVASDDVEATYGVAGAPTLVVLSPDGHVAYRGGYSERMGAPIVADTRVVARARAGEEVAPLPVFGCPVGQAMKRNLDPMGLR